MTSELSDATAGMDAGEHSHGPTASLEWILEGRRESVIPHLETGQELAPPGAMVTLGVPAPRPTRPL